jgi:hypothetical protein
MSNPAAPKILNDIVAALSTANINAVTDDDEGRVNSKKDEANVINWLLKNKKFKNSVRPVALRQFGDLIVTDEKGVDHYVNIKTSSGGSDNAFSKLGFLWAFTDLPIEKLPKSISNKKWFELITKHKKDVGRDYWFLSLDKSDMNNVTLRGVKQVENWAKNPTNNLQINWRKEHDTKVKKYTFEQAWNRVIIDGVLFCWEKYCDSMLEGIKYRNAYKK